MWCALILCTILGQSAMAQLRSQPNNVDSKKTSAVLTEANSKSPLEEYRDKKEDLSKRDLYSKHFINDDGSYTAIIGAGPMHYESNGEFLDIDHTVVTNSSFAFPYANKTNLMESYFGSTSHTGIKSVIAEGEIHEFINTKMYWEVNGQAFNTFASNDAQISIVDNKATYSNLFGNISAEFTVETARRKLNYIIPDAQALVNIPSGAQYLVFSEEVIIPNGWTYVLDERHGVVLMDDTGKRIVSFDHPVSTDQSDQIEMNNTTMDVVQNGNVLTVLTKVQTSWLLNSERQFPVLVDPTENFNTDGVTYRTAQTLASGAGAYGTIAVGYNGGFYRSYASFNVTSIPDNATISSTVLNHNVGATSSMGTARGSEMRAFLNDPESAAYPNWIDVYNGITNATNSPNIYITVTHLGSLGWKTATLGATANTHLTTALSGSNKFTVGYRPSGSYSGAVQIAQLYGEGDATRKPYIAVTYTASTPPSCATIVSPADAITNAASGNQLTWNAANGATSYDVYFGTSSTPPLAGNVTVTNYNPSCLQPNTTYYWRIVPKNANGDASGCATWSFTTTGHLAVYAQNWDGISTPGMFSEITPQDGWLASSTLDQSGLGDRNVWAAHTYADRSISGNSIGISAYYLNSPVATGELAYYDDLTTDRWVYRQVPTTGLKDVTVSFRYRAGGEAGADFGSVMYNPTGNNPQNVNNWLEDPTQGGNNDDNRFYSQPNPTYESILLPGDADNNANLRIGFRWTSNANSIASYPSFVVDDIVVSGCPTGGNIAPLTSTFNSSNSATLTLSSVLSCALLQWESAPSPTGPWTDISGATTNVLNTGTVSTSTYYRCKVYYGTCEPSYQTQVASVQIISPAVVKLYNYGGTTQLTFNNSRSNATNQIFRLSHSLVTATAYQIEVNTAADFSGTAYVQNFSGSYAANTQANYTFTQLAGSLVDGTTYYVRARVLESGSLYSLWTTGTYSFTYNAATNAADWFQTTQAQFQTGTLSGTEATPADNLVLSGSAGGSFVNPSFESTAGWSVSRNYTVYEAYRTNNANGTNGITNGSYCLKFAEDDYSWQYFVNGDYSNVSQEINLTGVSNIQFDITHWRNTQSNVWSCGTGRACKVVYSFQVIVGDAGTTNNNTGTIVYNWTPTTAEFGVTNNPNVTVSLSSFGFTGVKTVKFARVVTNGGGVWYDDDKYYLDNIRTNVSNSGSVASPTIYLASKQNVNDWDVLTWNQTLNGGSAVLKIQRIVGGLWTDVAGLNNITATGDGFRTQDISSLGLGIDSIRVVATMAGTTSPILHDWSVKAGGCEAVTFDTSPANTSACNGGSVNFSAVVLGANPITYRWQLSTDNGDSWNDMSDGGKYSGTTTSALNISNLTLSMNTLRYRLRATNECGSEFSQGAILTVQNCPPNNNPAPNAPNLNSGNYVYPNCFNMQGTTLGATYGEYTGNEDVWYQFVAQTNGVSIQVNSSIIDAKIYLFRTNDLNTIINDEDAVVGTGTEILNYGGLIPGQSYYIAVVAMGANEGPFSICVKQLRRAQCGTSGPYNLCTLFKSTVTGATTTTMEFTAGETTTSITSAGSTTLGTPSLQLMYGHTYSVSLTANYHLTDGAGQTEVISIANPNACSITLVAQPSIEVRSNQWCSNGATLFRNSYLQASPVGVGIVCGITGYQIEFTPVSDCNGTNPNPFEKITRTIASTNSTFFLGNAFNGLPLSNNPYIGYWSVVYTPIFHGGLLGNPSTTPRVIAVNGTSSSQVAGMDMTNDSNENIITNAGVGSASANLYPNPNNGDMVNLNMTGISSDNVFIRIMDSMGRVVYSNRYTVEGSLNTIVTFSKPLASGLYMVEFTSGNDVITQRMMVSK